MPPRPAWGDVRSHILYACWRQTRRVRELGEIGLEDTGPLSEVLAGEWVAYDRQHCLRDVIVCSGRIAVRSIRTGRQLRVAPTQPGRVRGLVLAANGTAAWIRRANDSAATPAVYTMDGQGVRTLDPGPDVAEDSLALAGSRAYWLRGETPMSELLN